jgi:hypothetical protein
MLVLAGCCALVGLVPAMVVRPALAAAGLLAAGSGPVPEGVVATVSGAAVGLSGVWGLLLGLGVLIWALRRRAVRGRLPHAGPTWGCAYAQPAARMQYTAGSFATPLLDAYGTIAGPQVARTTTSLETRSSDRVLSNLVRPLWDRTKAVAWAFRPLQQGPVTRYLQYVVVTVLILLAALYASIRLP